MIRRLPALLSVGGAATLVAAVVWWALTYWQVWTNDYLSLPQASKCLVADSTICRLAAALCSGQHRTLVAIYSPVTLWIGAAVLACGAWPAWRPSSSGAEGHDRA